ncbi:hypothetical protein CDL15_Pgr022895 [Punica granatum]|uniref:protein-serine/threonine phosphatase n=1 Tax=Punica granatum TaxID=22663 RepID=A0A218X3H5_PUNGR|nr:hypothetical protein CDL15_Pgr022895 [Punica granatum]
MTEVYCRMLNQDNDDSPEKCRQRRRRRIQMRRLSSLSTAGSHLAASAISLKEAADPAPEPVELTREGKRPRSSEGAVQGLPNSSPSSSGDDANHPADQRRHREPVYGMMSVTGRSREMEDAVDVRTPLCRPEITRRLPVHFFGVFDGHGGAHVAALLSLKMHAFMEEELMRLRHADENNGDGSGGSGGGSSTKQQPREEQEAGGGGEEKWREVMRRAFKRADELAMATCPCESVGSRCSCHPREVALGGSTAVVALLTPDHIIVGNCGDSRAVLCRGGRAIPLTHDHKFFLPSIAEAAQEDVFLKDM